MKRRIAVLISQNKSTLLALDADTNCWGAVTLEGSEIAIITESMIPVYETHSSLVIRHWMRASTESRWEVLLLKDTGRFCQEYRYMQDTGWDCDGITVSKELWDVYLSTTINPHIHHALYIQALLL